MKPTQSIFRNISKLRHFMSAQRRMQFVLLLILTIFASFAEVFSIGAILPFLGALTKPEVVFLHPFAQPFIKQLGLTSANQILLPLTAVFCSAAIIAGLMRLLLNWASIRLAFFVGVDLSIDVYRRTIYQPYAVHIQRNSSEVINGIMTKIGEVIFYILMPSLVLISSSFILISISIVILSIMPPVSILAFIFVGCIYAAVIKLSRARVQRDSKKIASESTRVIKSLQEGLGGIRDILIDGTQETFCSKHLNAETILRRAQGNNQIISQGPRYLLETLAILLVAVLAYVLSMQPDGIVTAIPILASIALGLQRILPALQQAYGSYSTILGAQSSLQDVLTLLKQPLPDYAGQIIKKPLTFNYQLNLNKISFRYDAQGPWILKEIDLVIEKGSRIGFIGTTGSGKSTLLDIIMGLLTPTSGEIRIDDQLLTASNIRSWQMNIAHVPQAIFLTDSSIEENIAFGIPKELIDKKRVRLAAQQAQIADSIEALPLQYQTIAGERGVQLSGGQRQRIGIARALYKQAEVIVFDEATSALDGETELAVMNTIYGLSKNITILIIAHRLSTLQNCTQIIELGSGVIQQNKKIIS